MASIIISIIGKTLSKGVKAITFIIRKFFKVIVLIVVGSLFLVLMSFVVSSQFLTPYVPLVSPVPVVAGIVGYYAGIISLFIIPILLLGKWIITYTFGYRSNSQFRKIMSGFWIVSFMTFVGTVIFSSFNFAVKDNISKQIISSKIDTSEVLQINLHRLKLENGWKQLMLGPAKLENGNLYADNIAVKLDFRPTTDTLMVIDKNVSSYGRNRKNARRNTSEAKHDMNLKGQTLDVDMFYTIKKKGKFRVQEIDYDINLPIGTKVKFNRTPYRILSSNISSHDAEDIFIMTERGLTVLHPKKDS